MKYDAAQDLVLSVRVPIAERKRMEVPNETICLTHHSRIWLHYQRTGRESLEGMTFDTNCTEWMHDNPRAKLSILQDNPGTVKEEAWALLAQEMGKPVKPEKISRKPYALTADLVKTHLLKLL